MRTVLQLILRQPLVAALLPLFFAVVQGAHLAWCLAHGSSLHGYLMEPGTGDGSEGILVSVWPLFLQTIASAGLAGALGVFGLWQKRGE